MANLDNKNLKIAVQKSGRLTEDTISFLRKAGLEFEEYKRNLFSVCRNYPLEILYVRDDDIPDYVSTGTVDLGIVGQNIVNEERPKVKKILDLGFGFCSLCVAIPKESTVKSLADLKNKTIATTYPNSTKKFFKENNIDVNLMQINGSVEITPALGIADAIADLASTGSTLALNDLKILTKIYESEAVLIANERISGQKNKNELFERLLTRFHAVMMAKNYKYVMMNAPKETLLKLEKVIPGLKSPTVTPLSKPGWISIQTVIKEDVFWDTIEKLKKIGATGIIVLPIEKMII